MAITPAKTMTLSDIARLAGVSESTASRALRDNPVINAQTRQKVQQIAAEHQFKVNATARSLRTQKSYTIAVIILFDDQRIKLLQLQSHLELFDDEQFAA